MPIIKTPKYLISHGEATTAARRLLVLMQLISTECPHISAVIGLLTKDIDAIDSYLNSEKKSPFNEAVQNADVARDETLRQAAGYFRGGQNHFDPIKADAFTFLYNIMARHQFGARKKAYAEQSAVVNSMILEMSQPQVLSAIELSDSAQVVEKIREDQKAFEDAIVSRIDTGMATEQPTLVRLTKPVRDGIKDILSYVSSRERLEPEKYASLVRDINAMLSEITARARARKNRKVLEEELVPEMA